MRLFHPTRHYRCSRTNRTRSGIATLSPSAVPCGMREAYFTYAAAWPWQSKYAARTAIKLHNDGTLWPVILACAAGLIIVSALALAGVQISPHMSSRACVCVTALCLAFQLFLVGFVTSLKPEIRWNIQIGIEAMASEERGDLHASLAQDMILDAVKAFFNDPQTPFQLLLAPCSMVSPLRRADTLRSFCPSRKKPHSIRKLYSMARYDVHRDDDVLPVRCRAVAQRRMAFLWHPNNRSALLRRVCRCSSSRIRRRRPRPRPKRPYRSYPPPRRRPLAFVCLARRRA